MAAVHPSPPQAAPPPGEADPAVPARGILVVDDHELVRLGLRALLLMQTRSVPVYEARSLAEGGYRPPLPERSVQVAGDVGIATFRMLLVNMLEGRFISPYDDEIATRIATVVSGGEVDRGSLVDEEWLLTLERRHFVELAQQEKTQARIGHMLKTGKPLRN